MNKIVVEVSVGELLDKISILEIKKEKIKDPEKLRFINTDSIITATTVGVTLGLNAPSLRQKIQSLLSIKKMKR